MTSNTRQWNTFQAAIFAQVRQCSRNVVVVARAGTGKTTTIVHCLSELPAGKSVLMCAFNKKIANELTARVPAGVQVKTTHAIGFAAIRNAWKFVALDDKRNYNLIQNLIGDKWSDENKGNLAKLVSLAKGSLLGPESSEDEFCALMSEFDCGPSDEPKSPTTAKFLNAARDTLEDTLAKSNVISYDDMVYVPAKLGMKLPSFDVVFVDETQDLNKAQLALVKRSVKTGGMVVAVGDDRQAIYRWRGADSNAMPNMVKELNAVVLPLSVTYRCGKSIVSLAQTLVPDYVAGENNSEGTINRNVTSDAMMKSVKVGDFVLSRTNAPLVRFCLQTLRAGIPANIQGKDIGAGLLALVNKSRATDINGLLEWLTAYQERETAKLVKSNKAEKVDELNDRVEVIRALCDGTDTIDALIVRMKSLFSDDDDANKVVFSSVHRAKGLERDNVFVLENTFKPSASVEESNLAYVAWTRAKHTLSFVTIAK